MADEFNPRTELTYKENEFDKMIRPQSFDQFSGQDKVLDNLKIFVKAAMLRGEALDHVLFHGPPGLGKTTLAHIVAQELGVNLKITSGPILDKPAMEDYRIDIMIDKGPGARSVQISLNPFTLIGATTRSGLLTSPLRARFGIQCHLEYYDAPVLFNIIKRSASILDIGIEDEAAREIALRSRGTPRIANSLLRRVRDFAQVRGNGTIDLEIARFALNALNIDTRGLDAIDNKILSTIIDKFGGGPVGAGTIATAISEDVGTLEEVYEPFLIKEGFLTRTPRGRVVTGLAYKHLGKFNPNYEKDLFS